MPGIDEKISFKPHSPATAVLTINSEALDAKHVVLGLDSVKVAFDDDEFMVNRVASGMTNYEQKATYSGTVEVVVSNSSPSIAEFNKIFKAKASLDFSFKISNRPDLSASCGYAYLQKGSDIGVEEATGTSTYIIVCDYLEADNAGLEVHIVS